jgi:hypothetical protein
MTMLFCSGLLGLNENAKVPPTDVLSLRQLGINETKEFLLE